MSLDYTKQLESFDSELATLHMRGQWQFAAPQKDQRARAEPRNEPAPAGVPHIWRWADVEPLIVKSCEALPESFTARRAMAFKNPELPRCTAQTMQMSVQVIRPHEIAWAHRHSMAAIRFVIQGNAHLYTVVDGIAYPMSDNDLVLTPKWTWHDHHNDSGETAIWLDVLDVPLVGGLHQGFYEELGETTQPIRNRIEEQNPGLRPAWGSRLGHGPGDCRYPWRETEPVLHAFDDSSGSDTDGIILDYINRATLGPTLATLNCQIQRLPPEFSGRLHRHTSSAVYFVVRGHGSTLAGDREMPWSVKDAFVVPNWLWHRHVNLSKTEDAVLFTVNDSPVLHALGLYREELDAS